MDFEGTQTFSVLQWDRQQACLGSLYRKPQLFTHFLLKVASSCYLQLIKMSPSSQTPRIPDLKSTLSSLPQGRWGPIICDECQLLHLTLYISNASFLSICLLAESPVQFSPGWSWEIRQRQNTWSWPQRTHNREDPRRMYLQGYLQQKFNQILGTSQLQRKLSMWAIGRCRFLCEKHSCAFYPREQNPRKGSFHHLLPFFLLLEQNFQLKEQCF